MSQQLTPAPKPFLGVLAVLLGASLATFFGRMLSVGAADIRGALGLTYDEASWISTTYNMALMFVGPFSVYLGGLLGPRRVLIASAYIFTFCCLVMPVAGHLAVLLVLLTLAGLSAGTFYPLTLSFVLRSLPRQYLPYGIGAYAADIIGTTHAAHSYEGYMISHLSWPWLFWAFALTGPVMITLTTKGMPNLVPQPDGGAAGERPNWRGFLYASLGAALIYGALDQGLRLDWWRSSTFLAMLSTGIFLVLATLIRHFSRPNPLVGFGFLRNSNILLLGCVVICFRFVLLASVILVPNFLATIQNYRPEQTGPVLLWLAIPQLAAGVFAVYLLGKIDSRIPLAIGFAFIAVAALLDAQVTTLWSGSTFTVSQLVRALGEGLAFNGMVGTIVLSMVNSGHMKEQAAALTFGGFFQTIRLMGGEAGSSFEGFYVHHRQVIHANLLTSGILAGSAPANAREHLLVSAMRSPSTSTTFDTGRAAQLFGGSVQHQAFTISIADNFIFIAYAATACLVLVACLRPLKIGFRQIIAAATAAKAA